MFLDELPEFGSYLLEALRQPLEDGTITISRASGAGEFPARVMVIAAMNPCPCGYLGDPVRACSCAEAAVTRYRKRISGPLLDRIDIHVDVPRVEYEKLAADERAERSACARERVAAARARQASRLAGSAMATNAEMGPAHVREHCRLEAGGRALMKQASAQLGLSARGYHRVLKVARTIADLAGREQIQVPDLAEALQYRPRNLLDA